MGRVKSWIVYFGGLHGPPIWFIQHFKSPAALLQDGGFLSLETLCFWLLAAVTWTIYVWSSLSRSGYVQRGAPSHKGGEVERGAGHAVRRPALRVMPVFPSSDSSPDSPAHAQVADAETAGRLPFCNICQVEKPARSKHCVTCGRCVRAFDHHCSLIGNCVGEDNHGLFVRLMLLQTALCAFAAYECYAGLPAADCGTGFERAMQRLFVGWIVICAASAGALALFHVYLTATDQTTFGVAASFVNALPEAERSKLPFTGSSLRSPQGSAGGGGGAGPGSSQQQQQSQSPRRRVGMGFFKLAFLVLVRAVRNRFVAPASGNGRSGSSGSSVDSGSAHGEHELQRLVTPGHGGNGR